MSADRRVNSRMAFKGGYLPPTAKIRPGREVVIVDLSAGGALVEGPWRFRPLSRCDVHLLIEGQDLQLRARIVRCFVARIERLEPVRYRTALAFDQSLTMPQRWDALHGYSIPREPSEPGPQGVADTPPASSGRSRETAEAGIAPILRSA